jgi:cyclohexa-1,5-dienecarbonyl-CoA hydratase
MELSNIIFEKKDRTAHIRLNRPPMNVIHMAMIEEINFALEQIEKDRQISVIVFTGAGEKAFSTGVDIKDHTLDKVHAMLQSFHKIFRTLAATDKLTVASVQGYCLGGAMELATFCNFLITADNAVFGQPEIKVGCYPPIATAWLPKLVGSKRAFEITMLGENISATDALNMGLVSKIVPAVQLAAETDNLISKLTQLSSVVLQYTKKALTAGMEENFLPALDRAESIYLEQLIQTEDIREGLNAFMEKRKPVWKNN